MSIDDRRVTEGDGGATLLQFTVTRTGDLTGATVVGYATADISATGGSDYTGASGSVSFSAGESVKQIAIAILGDTAIEPNEAFAVNLTGATGAAIVRDRGLGLIEENDRRVALSIQYIPRYAGYEPARTFRITNAGPSGATVALRVSESPYEGAFTCDGRNPAVCSAGFIPAGQFLDVTVQRSALRGLTATSVVPGRTLTATVSALEQENDVSDNTVARMVSSNGSVAFPPYLIAGTSHTAQATSLSGYFPYSVQLSLTGGVIVSPVSATVTEASPIASLDVTVSSSASGWSNVVSSSTALMRIPVVVSAEQVRLDTVIVAPGHWYSSYSFEHDEPAVIPVTVAATLPDGTRPSGSVTLKRFSDGTTVQTKTLDANAGATFSVSNLPLGSHSFTVTYSGDASFEAVVVKLPEVRIEGWRTYTVVVVNDRPCGDSEIVVTVRNDDGHTPTGTVKLTVGSSIIGTLPLSATETAGTARASMTYALPLYTSVNAAYQPVHPFEASSDWGYRSSSSTCPAPILIASASSPSAVSLIWSDVGAGQYEIVRAAAPAPGTFSVVGTAAGTTFVDTSAEVGKAYLYKVNAKSASGALRSTSPADLATTVIFTDDPLVYRATAIKATHINELQQAINAVRALAGLAAEAFPPVTPGSPVRPVDVTSLRTSTGEALTALGFPSPTWADGVGSGQVVKTLHVQQLRNAVK